MYDYMKAEPSPGDLIMEQSTVYRPERDPHRFGRLIRVVREPIPLPDEIARELIDGGEPLPKELAWYIEPFDGGSYRWVNAGFVRVPPEICSLLAPVSAAPSPGVGRVTPSVRDPAPGDPIMLNATDDPPLPPDDPEPKKDDDKKPSDE